METTAEERLPVVFEYLSYRRYLAAYYRAAKQTIPAFSYRYFSRRAGFSSPNFLKLVIDGQRNLGTDSVGRFARALEFNAEERSFFRNLVDFEQATSPADANTAYKKVASNKRFREARRIDHNMFVYLSHWYYPAIREMAARSDFEGDPEWIAQQLVPRIRVSEAKAALEVLFDLELLRRDDDGQIHRNDISLTTGHEVRSLAIGNYHRQMLERAADAIATVPSELRDLSALTLCIDAASIPDMKARIHAFRESMMEHFDGIANPEHVYQLNIQLFPLTDPGER